MMWTPEWIVEPSPIVTPSPMVANGWISTSLPIVAVGLTAASGLMPIRAASGRGQKWLTMAANAAMNVVDLNGRKTLRHEPPWRDDGGGEALLQQMGFLDLIDQRDLTRPGVAHGGGAEDHQLAVANESAHQPARQARQG